MEVPYLKIPRVAWVIPAKKVAVKASRRYSTAFVSGSISFLSKVPIKRETTATGPIAMSRELPMAAYIKGGTKLEYVKGLEQKATRFQFNIQRGNTI